MPDHRCDICGRIFFDRYHLRRHSDVSHAEYIPVHRCGICNLPFDTNVALSRHLDAHHRNFRYGCPFFHRDFINIRYLHRHREEYCCGVDSSTNISTYISRDVFNSRSLFNVEPRRYPSIHYNWRCPYCSQILANTEKLMAHLRMH